MERVGVRAPVRRPYSAPERIAGEEWGTPADVFSLAAIAYELLTGRRPSGTGEQIGELAGENVASHASAIRSVLARAMSEQPGRRYPTALGFASALESAARTGTVDARDKARDLAGAEDAEQGQGRDGVPDGVGGPDQQAGEGELVGDSEEHAPDDLHP